MNAEDSNPTPLLPSTSFTKEEMLRYERQLALPEIGLSGQRRLRDSSVLIVGAGGLGSSAALYLAAAGIGKIGIVDPDCVELSNLQRQILHGTRDLGRPKTDSAAERVAMLNPNAHVVRHQVGLSVNNAKELIGKYEVVVDGTDNYQARYLMNDTCQSLEVPYVYGAVFGFEGQVSVFDHSRGPCYRCLYPEPPALGLAPGPAGTSVLGGLPGVIGTMQAIETIKLILGQGQPLIGRLLVFDALSARFREFQVYRNPECQLSTS
jgi:molybdopterin/thiamine biosynthesis adenylyltransferase